MTYTNRPPNILTSYNFHYLVVTSLIQTVTPLIGAHLIVEFLCSWLSASTIFPTTGLAMEL